MYTSLTTHPSAKLCRFNLLESVAIEQSVVSNCFCEAFQLSPDAEGEQGGILISSPTWKTASIVEVFDEPQLT